MAVAVRDYLASRPNVQIVVVTRAYDVYVNPCDFHQLNGPFNRIRIARKQVLSEASSGKISTPPGVVLQGLRNCPGVCSAKEMEKYFEAMKAVEPGIQSFPGDQWMGYSAPVLSMLNAMLAMSPDQKGTQMFLNYVTANPTIVAIDVWEEIFGTAARGFYGLIPGDGSPAPSTAAACTFNGKNRTLCDLDRSWQRCCVGPFGRVEMSTLGKAAASPLIWDVPVSRWGATLSSECSQSFAPTKCVKGERRQAPADIQCPQAKPPRRGATTYVIAFFLVMALISFTGWAIVSSSGYGEVDEEEESNDNEKE